MIPVFQGTRTQSIDELRVQLRQFADAMGEPAGAQDIGSHFIDVVETKIPHGSLALPLGYLVYRKTGVGDVYETRPPDKKFFYLASSVAVTAYLMVL